MKARTIGASAVLALGAAAQDVVVTQTITPDCVGSLPDATSNCSQPILQYLNHVCLPTSGSTPTNPKYDSSAPCVATTAMVFQCLYGADGLNLYNQILSGTGSYGYSDSIQPLDNTTQRNCLCQSAWFDATKGCTQCYVKHGLIGALKSIAGSSDGPGSVSEVDASAIDSFSKSYCASTPTATQNLGDALLLGLASAAGSVTDTSIPTTGTVTLTDTLGNRTDVSLYYTTPSGSYWSVAIPTGSPSVSNGQVVATGSINAQAGSSSAAPGASATGKSGASGLASLSGGAVVALAGAVALL